MSVGLVFVDDLISKAPAGRQGLSSGVLQWTIVIQGLEQLKYHIVVHYQSKNDNFQTNNNCLGTIIGNFAFLSNMDPSLAKLNW